MIDGQENETRLLQRAAAGLLAMLVVFATTGCGSAFTSTGLPGAGVPAKTVRLSGHMFGGQQPVAGATIRLYGVSESGYGQTNVNGSYGSAVTDGSGGFTLGNTLVCTGNPFVYLVAYGGNPGLGRNNPNLSEMAALGPCDAINLNTSVQINELTTVASVYALSAFMTSAFTAGTSPTNRAGLAMAFSDVNELVNTTTGTTPGPLLPAGATLDTTKMNTLADIIAACVNSAGGTAGDGSTCGTLFSAATPPGGTAPTDTASALLNIAQNPANNVAVLFGLCSAIQVYAPALAYPPNDWMVTATYAPAGLSRPSSIAADVYGNVWIASSSGNSAVELSHTGALLPGSSYAGTTSGPSAVALDASGNPWVAQRGTSSLLYLTPGSGVPVTSGTGALSAPTSIAIDPAGNVWVSDGGANTVTELTSTGTPVSSTGYSGTGIAKPLGIAISPH